ncbi:hypothetical protein [Aeromicrobium sp. Root344]|uniref:hypothetical protein n=1 Tax=Aeromicrobium sp. Root344 TaxID=1736521 RepID=UPI000AAEC6DD|nr:hypothetical protein [Aeromicrobium sp. Root344]
MSSTATTTTPHIDPVGYVGPSAPFRWVKQSGLGREGAREGMREFCETQYASVDWCTA